MVNLLGECVDLPKPRTSQCYPLQNRSPVSRAIHLELDFNLGGCTTLQYSSSDSVKVRLSRRVSQITTRLSPDTWDLNQSVLFSRSLLISMGVLGTDQ